mgnify:CR=1 FL=1
MRIAASPVLTDRRRPVRAVSGVDRDTWREGRDGVPPRRTRPAAERPVPAYFSVVAIGDGAPLADARVVAQDVYCTRFTGRGEESSLHASRAYARADEMKFRSVPYTLQVA